jgi:hypothetical protein
MMEDQLAREPASINGAGNNAQAAADQPEGDSAANNPSELFPGLHCPPGCGQEIVQPLAVHILSYFAI